MVNGKKLVLPGTATKNLTASRWPWKESWACDMLQNGTNVSAVSDSPLRTIRFRFFNIYGARRSFG
jgi:hypothetical protein